MVIVFIFVVLGCIKMRILTKYKLTKIVFFILHFHYATDTMPTPEQFCKTRYNLDITENLPIDYYIG